MVLYRKIIVHFVLNNCFFWILITYLHINNLENITIQDLLDSNPGADNYII